jgi:preprotein translocase subunit SecE
VSRNLNPIEWASRTREFANEVQSEWKKITWPSRREVVGGTVAVAVVTAILSLVLFGVDAVLAWAVSQVLG